MKRHSNETHCPVCNQEWDLCECEQTKKLVQVDRKTWVEVDENIPDKVAIAKFNENIARESKLRYWGKTKKQ